MEKIAMTIADIENWFSQLDGFGIKRIEELGDAKNFHAVSMLLFSIINGAITIGEEIVANKRLGFPSSYREVFGILEKNKIISGELSAKMAELISYRNIFAHEYWSFSEKDVWEAMQKISSVKEFVRQAKIFLNK